MRAIEDLEHFVLAEGETLILRMTRMYSEEQLQHTREMIDRHLPGRPVLVLPPDVEVRAGKIEVFGVDLAGEGPTQEDVDATRKDVTDAYTCGHMVCFRRIDSDREQWMHAHHIVNPHTFDWGEYEYRLMKPILSG